MLCPSSGSQKSTSFTNSSHPSQPPPPSSSHGAHGQHVDESAEAKRRGLSHLVARYLGKPLDKSQQFSDWERRPLRVDQVKYAGKR